MKSIKLITLLTLTGALAFTTSCKKQQPEPDARDNKVGGCLDANAVNYDSKADYDDETCKYAYVNKYEITYHPEKDESGSDWDFLTYTDADLILRVKEQGATNWMFEGPSIEDVAHNTPAVWTAPSSIKLLNKTYVWELYDEDNGTADDFVSSGSFNPIASYNSSSESTSDIGTNAANDASKLVLHITLKD